MRSDGSEPAAGETTREEEMAAYNFPAKEHSMTSVVALQVIIHYGGGDQQKTMETKHCRQ